MEKGSASSGAWGAWPKPWPPTSTADCQTAAWTSTGKVREQGQLAPPVVPLRFTRWPKGRLRCLGRTLQQDAWPASERGPKSEGAYGQNKGRAC